MRESISLREMGPGDGPALERLNTETPDSGAIAFFTKFYYDPYETLLALHPGMVGVVAEATDHDGLVGMGLVNYGECLYEGDLLPYAYLNSLSVHPNYRRRGVASSLGSWRVEAARKRFAEVGREGVMYAAIQGGNTGSFQTAVKWSNQRIDGRTQVGITKMRTSPPKEMDGLQVRRAEDREFEEITEKQNFFYREYNLYPPSSAEELKRWRSEKVMGHAIHDYIVAVDRGGNLKAGMALTAEADLMSYHMVRLPSILRLANLFLKVLPSDGVARRISAKQIWAAPGNVEAGRFLWESVRWLWRERGSNLMAFFDPRGSLAQIVTLPKLAPKSTGSLVLHAPKPMGEKRLLYFQS